MRGPLNIARPIQGWPVIVQAGASEAGPPARRRDGGGGVRRQRLRWPTGQRFYADVKGRMREARPRPRRAQDPAGRLRGGRRHGGRGAREAGACSTASCIYDSGIASLSIALGHDASGFDPDGPLPEIPETNASKSARERVDRACQARQLDRARSWRSASAAMAGWPSSARRRPSPTRWKNGSPAKARDGFNIMFPYLPGGLDDFVDGWCRSCSAAASSAANTRARRCGRISG